METILMNPADKEVRDSFHLTSFPQSIARYCIIQMFAPTYSLPQAPFFDITAHSPSRRTSPRLKMVDQVFCWSIHGTNPRLPGRCSTGWRKWLCEINALHSKIPHLSESYIVHLFSRILDPMHSNLWNLDVPCLWNWQLWHLQLYPTVLHVCIHTIIFFLVDRAMTNVQAETFLRNPSPCQNAKNIHCNIFSVQSISLQHWHDSIFENFWACLTNCHSVLNLFEILMLCVLEKYSSRTQLNLDRCNIIFCIRWTLWNIDADLSTFLWTSMHPSQTKNWLWVYINLCFCPLECCSCSSKDSIATQSWKHPKSRASDSRSTSAWCRTTSWAHRSWRSCKQPKFSL